jgi:hypothetical protein
LSKSLLPRADRVSLNRETQLYILQIIQLTTEGQSKEMGAECGGNKYMQINGLNHLRHKTSQFKQGYTKLLKFGAQN